MWSLIIIFAFCFFFWLARRDELKPTQSEDSDHDMGPLAALYFAGFWEDDDAVH